MTACCFSKGREAPGSQVAFWKGGGRVKALQHPSITVTTDHVEAGYGSWSGRSLPSAAIISPKRIRRQEMKEDASNHTWIQRRVYASACLMLPLLSHSQHPGNIATCNQHHDSRTRKQLEKHLKSSGITGPMGRNMKRVSASRLGSGYGLGFLKHEASIAREHYHDPWPCIAPTAAGSVPTVTPASTLGRGPASSLPCSPLLHSTECRAQG
jgi:hypothetical protein